VNKHVFAATRRLNETISLCWIEPLHGTFSHSGRPLHSGPPQRPRIPTYHVMTYLA
jgi:hypothetical protein